MAYENFFQATRRKLLNNARNEGIAIGRDAERDAIIQQIEDQVSPEIIQQIKDQAGRNGNGNGSAGTPDDPR